MTLKLCCGLLGTHYRSVHYIFTQVWPAPECQIMNPRSKVIFRSHSDRTLSTADGGGEGVGDIFAFFQAHTTNYNNILQVVWNPDYGNADKLVLNVCGLEESREYRTVYRGPGFLALA
jgi:hypothetical protein